MSTGRAVSVTTTAQGAIIVKDNDAVDLSSGRKVYGRMEYLVSTKASSEYNDNTLAYLNPSPGFKGGIVVLTLDNEAGTQNAFAANKNAYGLVTTGGSQELYAFMQDTAGHTYLSNILLTAAVGTVYIIEVSAGYTGGGSPTMDIEVRVNRVSVLTHSMAASGAIPVISRVATGYLAGNSVAKGGVLGDYRFEGVIKNDSLSVAPGNSWSQDWPNGPEFAVKRPTASNSDTGWLTEAAAAGTYTHWDVTLASFTNSVTPTTFNHSGVPVSDLTQGGDFEDAGVGDNPLGSNAVIMNVDIHCHTGGGVAPANLYGELNDGTGIEKKMAGVLSAGNGYSADNHWQQGWSQAPSGVAWTIALFDACKAKLRSKAVDATNYQTQLLYIVVAFYRTPIRKLIVLQAVNRAASF